jgi:hypothetical protein
VECAGQRRPVPDPEGREEQPSATLSMNDVTRILCAVEQGDA